MDRFFLRLETSETNALHQLAKHERRDIREQAVLLIRRELERRGLLEPETLPNDVARKSVLVKRPST